MAYTGVHVNMVYTVKTYPWTLEFFQISIARARACVCVYECNNAFIMKREIQLNYIGNLINFLKRISNWLLGVLFITDFDFTRGNSLRR